MTENYEMTILRKAVVNAMTISLIVGFSLMFLVKGLTKTQGTINLIIAIVIILAFTLLTYFSVCRLSIHSQKMKFKIRKERKKLIPGCFIKISPVKNKLEEKEYFAKLLKNGTVEIYTKNPYTEYIFTEVLKLKKFVEKYKCVNDVENLN